MNIVSVCIHYPSPQHPTRGIFVERRLQAMAKLANVRVISPRPWFPLVRPYRERDSLEPGELPVYRPRMPYLPGVAKGWDGYWLAKCLVPIVEQLHAERPIDAIDAHFGYPEGAACAIVSREFKIPLFITVRGNEQMYLQSRDISRTLLSAFEQAKKIICVSHSLRNLLAEQGIDPSKLKVMPNAVDIARFSPGCQTKARRELGLHADRRYIVSIGGLVSTKGHRHLIESLSQLRTANPTLELIIIGGRGFERNHHSFLKSLTSSLGLNSKVHFVGQISPDNVAKHLRAADLFALATEREGCCNAVLESLACGCPVVTTPAGDNAIYVRNGTNGRIVDERSTDAFVNAISLALQTKWERTFISQSVLSPSWSTVGRDVFNEMQDAL